jgi:hypothetical protein
VFLQRAIVRTRKKSEEMQAIKRRLLDDFLRVKQRSSLFGAGLIRTPALYRELEECITRRFRQFVGLANRLIVSNPLKWAQIATLEVLQPFLPDDSELNQVVERVFDNEFLRAREIETNRSEAIRCATPRLKKLTIRQQAVVAIAKLWRANPMSSHKEIAELADKRRMRPPWPDCSTWVEALAKRENAVKTLFAKARKLARD